MTEPYGLFLRASMALSRREARKVLADARKLKQRDNLSTIDNNADETICKQQTVRLRSSQDH